jgi:hypothetical protein
MGVLHLTNKKQKKEKKEPKINEKTRPKTKLGIWFEQHDSYTHH